MTDPPTRATSRPSHRRRARRRRQVPRLRLRPARAAQAARRARGVPGPGAARLRGRRRRSPARRDPRQLHVRRAAVGPRPAGRSATGSRAAGGGWRCTARALRSTDGRTAGWRGTTLPLWVDTLGSQFVAHPPIAPYRVDNVAPDHWLVAGVEPFEATDELYLNDYPDRAGADPAARTTTYQGDARGFAEGDWTDADPDHLVMYLRPLGDGAVLYNTLGHCRGHYDMVPLDDYYPNVDRCSWELPVFYELLRRSLRWAAASRPDDVTARTSNSTRSPMELTTRPTAGPAPQHGAHPAVRGGGRARSMEPASCPASCTSTSAQEAVAAGVCAALRDDDQITSTHRGHGHLVAKGGDFRADDGRADGQGHRLLPRQGRVDAHQRPRRSACSAPTASSAPASPIAVGAAFAQQVPRLATRCRSRSSATARRTSAPSTRPPTWPARCTCRSCSCARTTSTASSRRRGTTMVITDIVDRAAGYGMPGVIVDGMDVSPSTRRPPRPSPGPGAATGRR